MDATLILEALQMVTDICKPVVGVIHHSGRSVQYASTEYIQQLNQHGFKISMSGKGNPYENAIMLGCFKTLKHEEVYL